MEKRCVANRDPLLGGAVGPVDVERLPVVIGRTHGRSLRDSDSGRPKPAHGFVRARSFDTQLIAPQRGRNPIERHLQARDEYGDGHAHRHSRDDGGEDRAVPSPEPAAVPNCETPGQSQPGRAPREKRQKPRAHRTESEDAEEWAANRGDRAERCIPARDEDEEREACADERESQPEPAMRGSLARTRTAECFADGHANSEEHGNKRSQHGGHRAQERGDEGVAHPRLERSVEATVPSVEMRMDARGSQDTESDADERTEECERRSRRNHADRERTYRRTVRTE